VTLRQCSLPPLRSLTTKTICVSCPHICFPFALCASSSISSSISSHHSFGSIAYLPTTLLFEFQFNSVTYLLSHVYLFRRASPRSPCSFFKETFCTPPRRDVTSTLPSPPPESSLSVFFSLGESPPPSSRYCYFTSALIHLSPTHSIPIPVHFIFTHFPPW
jgi:hypothetical protein